MRRDRSGSRSRSWTESLVVEVHQPVTVVDGQCEQTENGKTEQARDFGSKVAALLPHVQGGDPRATLPEARKLQKQTARLKYVRDGAVNAADSHAVIAVDFANLGSQVV